MTQKLHRYFKSVAFLTIMLSLYEGVLAQATFVGATGGKWSVGSNWSTANVPGPDDNVFIPSGKTVALDFNGAAMNNLDIEGVLDINSTSNTILIIGGPLSGAGTLLVRPTNAKLDIYLTTNGSNTIGTLDIGTDGNGYSQSYTTANLNGDLTVTNSFSVPYNSTLNIINNLILASTASGTATKYYATNGTINGNITIQRYIPADQDAAFRDLGVGVTGSTAGSLSSQVYEFTGGAWSTNPIASNTVLQPGHGYRAEINGPATITATGPLTGDVDVTSYTNTTPGGYTFLSNPFQAVLDFESFYSTLPSKVTFSPTFSQTPSFYDGFWYLDPTVVSGGYQTYVHYGTLTGIANVFSGGLSVSQYLQPGQGFFIQTQSDFSSIPNSSVKLSANGYTSSTNQYNVFGTKAPLNRIATGLFTNGKNVDGAVAVFNSVFKNGIDIEDGSKISNHGENLTFLVGGKDLCANATSLPTATDVLAMHLYNLKANTAYTLKLDASQFIGNGLNAYLQDNVTNTKTILSGANNEVSFTTGTDASAYATRYSIVFGASPLPVKNISLTAAKLGNSQVAIKWSTIGESNISNYKIERSSNGNSFTALATVSPSAAHSYSYIDASATAGTNYYRIKVIDVTGGVSYSKVVTINTNNSQIAVYPNPVTGTNFKVSLGNSGKYNVSVVNMLGQKVFSTVINHNSGTLSTVAMAKQLAAGNYRLVAVDEDGTTNSTALTIK